MADANDRLVSLGHTQNKITGIEAGLLVLTLVFTALATKAASKAARAADAAVKVTEKTAQRQLRAYVSHEKFEGKTIRHSTSDKILGYQISVFWKNFGQTPARRVRSHIVREITPAPLATDYDYPDIPSGQKPANTHIGPGGNLIISLDFDVAQIEATIRKQAFIAVWGWVEYNDVFPDTPRRRTEFCAEIVMKGALEEGKLTVIPNAFGPYNGADDDCLLKPKTTDD